MKTKRELKEIVSEAMKSEYGFAPKKNEITLMEANDTGTYINFWIGSKEYRFDSHICTFGGMKTIWVGEGTIEKMS